jgi:hypothetical protein
MRRNLVAALLALGLLAGLVVLAGCGDNNDKGGRKASIGSGDNKPDLPPGQVQREGRPDKPESPGRSAVAPGTQKALENLQKRIQKRAEKRNAGESFAVSVNGETGRIELQTSASEEVAQQLLDSDPDPASRAEAKKAKVEIVSPIKHDWNRRDDIPAFWNGAGLNSGGGLCSNGYAARRNSDGRNVAVTAGHCFAVGATVKNESGTQTFGQVIDRHYGGTYDDFELISGSSYAGRVYTGDVNSTSSIPVVSAGGAYVGSDYCVSGRTSGTPCGLRAESTDAYVCFTDGFCRDHSIQIHENGAGPGPGDSGGTFFFLYNGAAYIRGSHMGGNDTTSWEQSWVEASSKAGLSIITG